MNYVFPKDFHIDLALFPIGAPPMPTHSKSTDQGDVEVAG
jgi:hypothetical protein